MKFGINTFLFVSPFTTKSVTLFKKIKAWGFDSVELAIEDPSHIDAAKVKEALDRNGLTCCSICGAFGPDRDLRGNATQQKTSMKYMKDLIDAMVILDCPALIGPVYSAVGRADQETTKDKQAQFKTIAKNLKELCKYAEERGKVICLEPLNRFETDCINTCDQGLKMLNAVKSPALKLHLDSFHMNIEEKNQQAAIEKAGATLGHFHACGSDRGTPGSDHTDWKGIATAMKKIGYDGAVVIESFTPDVKVIAKAASIWRNIEPKRENIAVDGLKFLKKALAGVAPKAAAAPKAKAKPAAKAPKAKPAAKATKAKKAPARKKK
jgi:D-psicose/D-tagatose/L-ribulose 3-epimerase